ncbi:hypothetical protein Sme01_55770 [Sphaerisporangium melleum]|uniref:UspA domain-containing protein n=1 Tax=Sphaerisporangium melleum TaxID=321316 RepID=A0A917RQ12_9ACTN|nr:universal stress protein [Sphaerisporangium melleum]GGL17935.1 hypothetical protein GCM10007964_69910 [Sphaerisporangium melleum]GII73101.1 hypothetical protein Sme01_55770 [Sphaerisporangium melleum]
MFKNILVAIDGSERGEKIIDIVEGLAKAGGARVHVLHANESEIVGDQVVDLEEDTAARAIVDRAVAGLQAAGLQAAGDVAGALRGDVPDLILSRAAELGSDLIVLGPRHHGRVGALLGGSVTHEVTLHTTVSLLLVV